MTEDTLATNEQCDSCRRAERDCPSYPQPVGRCKQYQGAEPERRMRWNWNWPRGPLVDLDGD